MTASSAFLSSLANSPSSKTTECGRCSLIISTKWTLTSTITSHAPMVLLVLSTRWTQDDDGSIDRIEFDAFLDF
ncbi:hypothetical protein BaRGS_00031017, partial [Batillaria attramentaria]